MRSRGTDRPLYTLGPVIQAMFRHGDEVQQEESGKLMTPWMPMVDTMTFKDRGALRAVKGEMPLASAVTREGGLALLKGMSSRDDFFERPPYIEGRDHAEHESSTLIEACACEALAQGRFDIVRMLAESAKAFVEKHKKSKPDQWETSSAKDFLQLDEKHARNLLYWLVNAKKLTLEQKLEGFIVVKSLCNKVPPYHGVKSTSETLVETFWSVAVSSGNPISLEAGLKLGAKPAGADVMSIAREGNFELAAKLIKDKPLKERAKRGGGYDWDEDRHAAATKTPIASIMAENYEHCFSSIIEGVNRWRDPYDTGRESTWAAFLDGRVSIHTGAILAIRGELDFEWDTKKTLDKSKDLLASYARAMATIKTSEAPDVDIQEIIAARPNAPVTAEELKLIASTSGSHPESLLPITLAKAEADVLEEFTSFLISKHPEYRKAVEQIAPGRRQVGFDEALKKQFEHLDVALFELKDQSQRLNKKTKAMVQDYLTSAGLDVDFEKRLLDRVAHQAQVKSKGPLKI